MSAYGSEVNKLDLLYARREDKQYNDQEKQIYDSCDDSSDEGE